MKKTIACSIALEKIRLLDDTPILNQIGKGTELELTYIRDWTGAVVWLLGTNF